MAYTSLREAFIGLQATQQPKDLFGVYTTSPMPSPPDMATAFDDTIIGSQYDPFDAGQYMDTLEKDEGFISVAKRLPKGKDPETGETIYEEFPTGAFGDYGPHIKVGQVFTKEQDRPRFQKRAQERVDYLKKTFPNFADFPFDVRNSMVSSTYRGSLPGSPKTIKFIQEGNFMEAGEEFLRNQEYKDAEGSEYKSGIRPRMERLSNALKGMAE